MVLSVQWFFFSDLEEFGLDSWKGKEFVCLPEGPYRLFDPHSLLLGS